MLSSFYSLNQFYVYIHSGLVSINFIHGLKSNSVIIYLVHTWFSFGHGEAPAGGAYVLLADLYLPCALPHLLGPQIFQVHLVFSLPQP